MQALKRCVFLIVFVCSPLNSCTFDKQGVSSPAPELIFGNPGYRAISFGGYRGLTREDGPTVPQLVDDVKILAAMDIKLLRTYNTRPNSRKPSVCFRPFAR